MDVRRRTPLRAMRPKEPKTGTNSTAALRNYMHSPKRPAAERRNLPPLPKVRDAQRQQQHQEEEGETHDRRYSVSSLEPLQPLQRDVQHTSGALLQQQQQQQQQPRISSGVKKNEKAKNVSERAGMQKLHIRRSVPLPHSVKTQEPIINCDTSATRITTPQRTFTFTDDDQIKFNRSLEILNTMMSVESKNVDARAWVTRFVEGKSEARLSKEHLFPVWILVCSDAVLAIDLNGTSKHRNYSWISESQFTYFPPDGCIVFPLQDVLVKGEVKLPQSAAEAAAMQMPLSQEIRWGVPLAVLFLNPHESLSIVRDVCQTYLPSFLQTIYADGVPLKGHWEPREVSRLQPGIIPLAKTVSDAIYSCMSTAGVGTFAGEGNRLREIEPRDVSSPLRRDDFTPEKKKEEEEQQKEQEEQEKEKEQQQQQEGRSLGEVREWCSPWESSGKQLIYTARLYASGTVPLSSASTMVCHAVLVLTPRGPLELIVEPPTMRVTVKDVKKSLLRSGLGRSLRLQQDAVGFIYAPSTPVLEEDAVIDVRYAVLRLQTQN
ncbi:uncharacterized protein TM35_000034110 [Trypanosoma theileri]|uniref:Uncharacterized protein n=1 Tax=Trypanosoma theileri TaxID=67003 RepID=A0A1X0P715_9TRYP|nr:uncharacterized protein TM35_000034110 [Trypanosoma theileri]ORC92658.1 hypothetical protein TM35_000034110 [Trypanosoma theileri]